MKVNLQGIMNRAHEIARQCTGDYTARLVLGLRQAWTEARLLQKGSRWTKGQMDRIYFNNLAELYGVQTTRYNTGNISSATLDGERISNSQAGRICGRLALAKVWYDISTTKFHGKDIGQDDFAIIVANLRGGANQTARAA